jgi:hypothetical protein
MIVFYWRHKMAAAEQGVRDVVKFEANRPVEVALKYAAGKVVQGIGGERVMFSLVDGRVMFLDREPAGQVSRLGAKPGEPIQICMQWSGKRGEAKEWTAWLSAEAEQRRAQREARAKGDTWTEAKIEDGVRRRAEIRRQVIGALPTVEEQFENLGDGDLGLGPRERTNGAGVSRTPAPAQAALTPSSGAQPPSNGNGSSNGGQGPGGAARDGNENGRVPVGAQVLFPWAARLLGETNALVDVYAAAAEYAKVRHGGRVSAEDVRELLAAAYASRRDGGCDAA